MSMKRAWILLGDSNVKKSTVIRALTGTGNVNINKNLSVKSNKICQIERLDGLRFSLVPYTSAMQEGEGKVKIVPEDMLKHFNNKEVFAIPESSLAVSKQDGFIFPGVRNFLFCLHNKSNFSDPKTYVELLLQDEWNIEAIISLGAEAPNWLQYSGIRYAAIPNAKKLPGSVVAYKVRDFFQWK